MAVKIKNKDFFYQWHGILFIVSFFNLYACNQWSHNDDYLIRVGNSTISVSEFTRAVDANSEEAFPGEKDVDTSSLNVLRMRVLNQLTDELIIIEHAKKIGIYISDKELENSIAAVKSDYPDDTFEKTLLENAVSFQVWKKKMATRLLIDKLIAKELVDKVQITSEDVAVYFRNHFSKGIPEGEDANQINKRIVRHLRRQKAEKLYQGWIDSLRKVYPVDIHKQRWNRLVEKNE